MPALILEPRLVSHHVGGRDGGAPFANATSKFLNDTISVLYDADPDCVDHAGQYASTLGLHKILALPYCVGGENGPGEFNLNYDPYTSSLAEYDSSMDDYYCAFEDYDYPFAEVFKAVKKIPVDIVTLDKVMADNAATLPPPDFLSLDAEATEFEVLCGGENTVRSEVVAIEVETSFIQIRKNQKLFGEIAALLGTYGFTFVQFTNTHQASPYRAPVGLRGKGNLVVADGLFFRDIDSLCSSIEGEGKLWIKLRKLAMTAILYGHIEYAIKAVGMANSLTPPDTLLSKLKILTWHRFIDKFIAIVDSSVAPLRSTFADAYSIEESFSRFKATPKQLEDIPGEEPGEPGRELPAFARLLAQKAQMIANLATEIADNETDQQAVVESEQKDYGIPLKELLFDHGLEDITDLIH